MDVLLECTYTFQLQILKFDVKLSIYLCSRSNPSRAILKNGIRNGTIKREIGIVQSLGVYESKGREKIFLFGICFQMYLQSIISETCLLFSLLSIILLPVAMHKTLDSYLVLFLPLYLI